MKNIQFDEPIYDTYQSVRRNHNKGLTVWLLKKNIVKDRKQSQNLLLIITIIATGIALFLLFTSTKIPAPGPDPTNVNTNIQVF